MDKVHVRQTQVGFEERVHDESHETGITYSRDQEHEFPPELHENTDGEYPENIDFFAFVFCPDIMYAKYGIPDKENECHDTVVRAGASGDGYGGKAFAEVLTEKRAGEP